MRGNFISRIHVFLSTMAITPSVLVIIFCMGWAILCSSLNETSFFYPNFDERLTTGISVDLEFYGAASVSGSAFAVDIVNQTKPLSNSIAGAMLSNVPLNVWDYLNGCTEKNSSVSGIACLPSAPVSFIITFKIKLASLTKDFFAGKGMLFFLMDNNSNPLGKTGSHFGVFPAGGFDAHNKIWGVEFDTHQDDDVDDIDDNHVGIDVNNALSQTVRSMTDLSFDLNSELLMVWIEYNSATAALEVRLSNNLDRPLVPFLQVNGMDIRNVLGQQVYPGFSATGNDQLHRIFLWGIESTTTNVYVIPPPPPGPVPKETIYSALYRLDFQAFIKASGVSLSVAASVLVAAVFLVLRLTKRGQRILLKMYAKVEKNKCCSKLCGLGVCVLFCTIPRDNATATDLGKSKKKTADKIGEPPKKGKKEKNGKVKKKTKLPV